MPGRDSMTPERARGQMKTTRRIVLTLILVSGLAGSIAAFVYTPMVWDQGAQGVFPCGPEFPGDVALNCIADTQTAAVRGAGVLVLAVVAFAGVTIIFKDDVKGQREEPE